MTRYNKAGKFIEPQPKTTIAEETKLNIEDSTQFFMDIGCGSDPLDAEDYDASICCAVGSALTSAMTEDHKHVQEIQLRYFRSMNL